jgi:predicted HicB family RNase H-like nuclease
MEGARKMDVNQKATVEERAQQAKRFAADRFRLDPEWAAFYRDVLGVDGIVDRLFPTFEDRTAFEKTPEHTDIQTMLAKLRERNRIQKQCDEPTRVITVRLPKSLHEALRHEAHNHKTSMNKLCISKLLQVVADELVPSDLERRGTESPAASMPPQIAARTTPIPSGTPTTAPSHRPVEQAAPSPLRPPSGPHSTPGGRPF